MYGESGDKTFEHIETPIKVWPFHRVVESILSEYLSQNPQRAKRSKNELSIWRCTMFWSWRCTIFFSGFHNSKDIEKSKEKALLRIPRLFSFQFFREIQTPKRLAWPRNVDFGFITFERNRWHINHNRIPFPVQWVIVRTRPRYMRGRLDE